MGITLSLLIMVVICGFCFDYVLDACVGKNVPWYIDGIAGFLTGALVVPVCVVCWVLKLCDVQTPFFKLGK